MKRIYQSAKTFTCNINGFAIFNYSFFHFTFSSMELRLKILVVKVSNTKNSLIIVLNSIQLNEVENHNRGTNIICLLSFSLF